VTEAKAKLSQAVNSVANFMNAIEAGAEFSPALQKALKEAEQREQSARQEVSASEHDLLAMEIKDATRLEHTAAVNGLMVAMRGGDKGQMLDRLRYALSRTVDRIVLEDSDDYRTVRLEIGNQTRYIDFSKKNLTYSLRGEFLHGFAVGADKSGSFKRWIP
jgi:hypothetical protein